VKTKFQQRTLAGETYRGPLTILHRLLRGSIPPLLHLTVALNFSPPFGVGPDPNSPKTLLQGFTRIYRGLGVSAARSIITHGMLWTFVDAISSWIDRRTRYLNDSMSTLS